MFDRWKKHWRMTRSGLLTFVEAQGFAAKLVINVLQQHKDDADAPAFVHMMVRDADYVPFWAKRYYEQLEGALDRTTLIDQAKGLRRLTLDCLDAVAEGIWTIYETSNPWKPRSEAAQACISKQIRPGLNTQDFIDYEGAQTALADLSQRVTRIMSAEFLGDDASNYADAYESMSQLLWQLRCEGIVCAAAGGDFSDRAHLEFLEVLVPTRREHICEGHNLVMDDSFREVVLRQRGQPAHN